MEEVKIRKRTRLSSADYNKTGRYFLTICTLQRRCTLSLIPVGTGVPDGPLVKLLPYGKTAEKYIKQLNEFYDDIEVEHYVIMPNHIHMILAVKNGPSRTPVPTEYGVDFSCTETNDTLSTNTDICPHRLGAGPSGTPVPTRQNSSVSRFVSTFKRFCNKEIGTNIWQYRSFDHIIRSRQDYEEHLKYIHQNPRRWFYDELYSTQ